MNNLRIFGGLEGGHIGHFYIGGDNHRYILW